MHIWNNRRRRHPIGDSSSTESGAKMQRERFYGIFSASTRSLALRQLRDQDAAADCSSQCLMLALDGIRQGSLREPAAIAGYIWGILRNLIRKTIAVRMANRQRQTDQMIESLPGRTVSPEDNAILSQQQQNVRKALAVMPPVAREILRRFYLDGSSATEIQKDLALTPTQFRLMKNRAKITLAQTIRGTDPPVVRRPLVRKTKLLLIAPKVKRPGIATSANQHKVVRAMPSASVDVLNCAAA
jgi:RNA polymerase sigma factor (sigma-70 family)